MTAPARYLINLHTTPETEISANMSIRHFKENELLVKSFKGVLMKTDFMDSCKMFVEIAANTQSRNILIDLREAKLGMSYNELMEVAQQLIQVFQVVDSTRVAIVADKPLETAFAFSVKRMVEESCTSCAKSIIVCSLLESGMTRLLGDCMI